MRPKSFSSLEKSQREYTTGQLYGFGEVFLIIGSTGNKPACEPAYEPTNWSANKLINLFHLSNFSIFSFIRTIKDSIIKPPQQKWSHFKEKCNFEMIYCKSMQTKQGYKMALRQSAIVYKW